MQIKIITLAENTVASVDLFGEWGISVLVEADDVNVLLDAGLSISAVHNADNLGIDLSKVDRIVLSHGHYDHTGGLRSMLLRMGRLNGMIRQTGGVEVIAHPDIFALKYSRPKGGGERYIGMPFSREELESLGARFHLTAEPVKVSDNIMTTGEITMHTSYEQIGSEFYVKEGGSWRPDKLADDQALIIKTSLGLVVILGCAHRGVINTLLHAQKLTGIKSIHTVIGGTHLLSATEEQIRLTIGALKGFGIQRLGVSHCTGLPAAALLAHEFGDIFFFNNAGTQITLPAA